ncbi:hypothetical protein Q7P37_009363 [Cladosporium fusiforme]
MHAYLTALALAGSVSARVLPRGEDGCCFQLKASGEQSGLVGQLGDGQNRIGGGYEPATYCINNGEITDSNGRGCILTPPTSQFQCDEGAQPTEGFSISSKGGVQYNGSGKFYACGADKGEYNIYTKPVDGQDDCVVVSLSSSDGKCSGKGGGGGQAGSSAPAQSAASTKPVGGKSTAPAQPSVQKPSSYAQESQKPSAPAETPSQPAVATSQPKPSIKTETSIKSVKSSAPVESEKPQTSQAKPETSVKSMKTSAPAESEKPQTSQPAAYSTAPAGGQPKPETSVKSVKTSAPAESEKPKTSQPAPYSTAPAESQKPKTGQAPQGTAPAGHASSASSQAASSAKASGTSTGSACQTSLTGAYQTPHLIVPVSSEQPDKAYGTSYNGQINSTTNTIFNFDIPQDYEGKQCSIIFLFPKKEDLETSDYEFGGSGSLGCSELSDAASEKTSYSNAPSAGKDLGTVELQPGNSYVVATQECKAGQTQSIELSSENGLSLDFFQDWNPSPLGLYITSC